MTTTAQLDAICQSNTAFKTFAELLSAAGYSPSIDLREPWGLTLANAYDAAMTAKGDSRRAYRYGADMAKPVPEVPKDRTTMIRGYVAKLWFEVERGELVSCCHVSNRWGCSSLALLEDQGIFQKHDGEEGTMPSRTIEAIGRWARENGY